MKKILALLTIFTVLMGAVFAETVGDNPDDPFEREKFEKEKLTTQLIVPENQHCTDKNASVRIEYQPIHDEVRIYYECMNVTYDEGQAMNALIGCLDDFRVEHNYNRYYRLKEDKVSFKKDDKGRRKAIYMAHIKFAR